MGFTAENNFEIVTNNIQKRNLLVDKRLLKSIECKKKRLDLYEKMVQEQLYNENSIISTPKEKYIQELKVSLEKNEL